MHDGLLGQKLVANGVVPRRRRRPCWKGRSYPSGYKDFQSVVVFSSSGLREIVKEGVELGHAQYGKVLEDARFLHLTDGLKDCSSHRIGRDNDEGIGLPPGIGVTEHTDLLVFLASLPVRHRLDAETQLGYPQVGPVGTEGLVHLKTASRYCRLARIQQIVETPKG